MTARHVVVDGSNIATEGRSLPSLQQLDEAVRAFLAERPHDICTVVVDATFEHRIDASERATYDEALAANELLTPPAGSIGRGDKFILEIADRANATVFSNDSFNDLRALHGDKAVWNLIEHRPERVARVTVDADFPPDIDTIEDYQRMLETERRMTIAHPIQSGPHR